MAKKWSEEEIVNLEYLYSRKYSISEISKILNRSKRTIIVKASSLGLYKKYRNIFITNTYNLCGDFGIGYTSGGYEFYFDLEDYEKIKDYSWWKDKRGYLVAVINGKNIRQHRLIMNCFDLNFDVDHIYHKLNDNRKSKLRIVTSKQNGMNKKIKIDNKSGTTGVSYDKIRKKWRATIGLNNVQIYLGRFKDKEEAIKARKLAEIKYFGEFRYKEEI